MNTRTSPALSSADSASPRDSPTSVARTAKAIQFPVHNVNYPRNRRIREYLQDRDWQCTPIVRGKKRKTTRREKFVSFASLLKEVRTADVIILSEMSLKYAPITWALSRIFRAVHIVDGFIGLYETDVEDKGIARAGSLKARILKFQDRMALKLSDIYLVDTEVRAQRLRESFGPAHTVHSLPVGAPAWACPSEVTSQHGAPQVLYYGNYIPLHGLGEYVRAIAEMPAAARPVTKMIGSGDCYQDIVDLVNHHGLSSVFRFHEPVPENQLPAEIGNAKVVLGIFGSSPKAASVIANKVWQGLACSRTVITRESGALDEISGVAGDLLVQVPANDPGKLGAAVLDALEAKTSVGTRNISADLEAYVVAKFDALFVLMHQKSRVLAPRNITGGDGTS